jgi:hypothetical protein
VILRFVAADLPPSPFIADPLDQFQQLGFDGWVISVGFTVLWTGPLANLYLKHLAEILQ